MFRLKKTCRAESVRPIVARELFLFGILYSCVIDGAKSGTENLFCFGYLAEGDGAFVEVAFADLCADNLLNHRRDALLGVFGEASRGGFHGIGHHQNGLL